MSVEHVDCVPQHQWSMLIVCLSLSKRSTRSSEYSDTDRCVNYFNNVHIDKYMALLLDSADFELQVRGG